jgi:tryptophan 7-halogenase
VINTVGVVGGGTAGYFTAIALKRAFPELEVTVVESSSIPVIGVGEATTPLMPPFLHHQLGIDVEELFRAVRPTWKLGIKFFWGAPDDYSFCYPFGDANLLESLAYEGDLNHASITSILMGAERGPIMRQNGRVESLLTDTRFAYHLENRSFVRLLAMQARRLGIRRQDVVVVGARRSREPPALNGEGGIESLALDGGATLRFDLYIDCTGFRSLLLEGALGSTYTSYADSLWCDSAVVAEMPHGPCVYPFTLAETMDHGWCWGIPVSDELHRGYVFASSFTSAELAEAEMRRKNPTMGEARLVRFRSGRHANFWRGNVVAVGNSFGFVEPLESTALHMVILEVQRLIGGIERIRKGIDPRIADIDGTIVRHWDYLRWFLALHYRFNEKLDTPFWQECRAGVDVSGLQYEIDEFRAGGPLSVRHVARPRTEDPAFGLLGIDTLLLGQRLPRPRCTPRYDREAWDGWAGHARAICQSAVSQLEALTLVDQQPELLSESVNGEASWVRRWSDRIGSLEVAGPFELGSY